MSLPIRTTLEDVRALCSFLRTKPTGTTRDEAAAILDSKIIDGRKVSAMKYWGILDNDAEKLKLTPFGREIFTSEESVINSFRQVIKRIAPYNAIIERATHKNQDSMTSTDVAALWVDHFKAMVGESDKIISDQAVCFFRVAEAANLGTFIAGRKGAETRFSFNAEALKEFGNNSVLIASTPLSEEMPHEAEKPAKENNQEQKAEIPLSISQPTKNLGQGIFIAHGKNKTPLEQLKKILDQFKIPYMVSIDEPNLGRPISSKVREIMHSCNCAILIFSADELFKDHEGKEVWRPSENVVFELGASGFVYDNRIVIMKEDKVSFPTNFRDIGYISFESDQLSAKALDILKELIGFGIVKVST
jgi:predicted nucleotide-binding protein